MKGFQKSKKMRTLLQGTQDILMRFEPTIIKQIFYLVLSSVENSFKFHSYPMLNK